MTNTVDTFTIHDTVVDDIFLADDGICVSLYPYELNFICGLTAYPQIPVNAMLMVLATGWEEWQWFNPDYEEELYPYSGCYPESHLEIELEEDACHFKVWFTAKDGHKETVLVDALTLDELMALEEDIEVGC